MAESSGKQAERGFGETLSDALDMLASKGYPDDFCVAGPGRVTCLSCRQEAPAETVTMGAMIRVEGVSDPADEEIIAGVTCPDCHAKGTLVLSYGANASPEDGEVARRLKDERPGTTEHD